MGNRLTKIYTRTGDQGTTGLGDGSRIDKNHPRIEVIGDIDELNCTLGLVLSQSLPEEVRECLFDVQHRLFDLGGELSMPGYQAITADDVTVLEQRLDAFNEALPPLKEFILPGGSPAAAFCHLARATCRRAERRTVALAKEEPLSKDLQRYINRLSDLLFVICRVVSRHEGGSEVLWRHDRRPKPQTPEPQG
ncbi:MAG: cob(I)yrinic acid a,c-diamide adenosyltransferase [Candidatus Competibacterales bacterium]